jgi:hypothetical protein
MNYFSPKVLFSKWALITGVSISDIRIADESKVVFTQNTNCDLEKWKLGGKESEVRADWRDWIPFKTKANDLGLYVYYVNVNAASPSWENVLILYTICSIHIRIEEYHKGNFIRGSHFYGKGKK